MQSSHGRGFSERVSDPSASLLGRHCPAGCFAVFGGSCCFVLRASDLEVLQSMSSTQARTVIVCGLFPGLARREGVWTCIGVAC